jgi:hypothetical protein
MTKQTMQEIETKIMSLLCIKKCEKGLTQEEQKVFNVLNNKYRDEKGHLIKGSFYVNSESQWIKV